MGIDIDSAKNWVVGGLTTLIVSSPAGQVYNHFAKNSTPAAPPPPVPTILNSGPEIQGAKELAQCTKDLTAVGVTPDKAAKTCLTGIQENNEALLKQEKTRSYVPSGM